MKHFTKIMSAAVLTAATLSFPGCQDYDAGFDAQQIKEAEYAKNFEKTFGEVDPKQNWDLFGQLAAGQNGTRAITQAPLLGDVDVTDLPESQYAYLTKEQAERYQLMLPESESSGLAYDETNLGRVVQNFKVKTQSFVLYPVHWNTSGNDVVGFYYHVPQGTTGAEAVVDVDGNTNYICKVQFYENKTHLYYTQRFVAYKYWNDIPFDLIDSYWDDLVASFPTVYTEVDGEKQIEGTIPFNNTNMYNIKNSRIWGDLMEVDPDMFVLGDNLTTYDSWGNKVNVGVKLYSDSDYVPVWTADTEQNALAVWSTYSAVRLQSRGIKVTLPESAEIGLYLTNGGVTGHTFYSESKLNEKTNWEGSIGEKESCFVATYLDTDKNGDPILDKDGNQIRYLCFEDWYGVKNFDLNDVVFRVYGFDGPGATVVDKDSYNEEALLVCEDLGNFDFDFNDVALKLAYHKGVTRTTVYKNNGSDEVDHVDIEETADVTVTAMAAGGANESTITLKTNSGNSNIDGDGEIHKLLNGNAPSIINAGDHFGAEGKSVKINATELAAWDKATYPTYLSQLFATGFVEITTEGGDVITKNKGTAYTKGMSDSPTMMLLPMSFEWPTENTLICDAYPGFSAWVENADATGWINGKVSNYVTKR